MFLRFCLYVAKILILEFCFVPLLLLHLHHIVCPPFGNTYENRVTDRPHLKGWVVLISPKETTSLTLYKVLESNLIL